MEPVPRRRAIRVLVVDDSAEDCLFALQALADRGRAVQGWRRVDTREQLADALTEPWDLVLLDWRMPGLSTEQALEQLRGQRAPVVVLSGLLPRDAEIIHATELGAAAFLEKHELSRLADVVDRVLMAAGGSVLLRTAAEILAYPELAMAILDAAPVGILAVNAEGLIRLVNHEAQLISGYHRSELVGHAIEMLVPRSIRVRHASDYRALYTRNPRERPMASGRPLRMLRKDGSEIAVDIMLKPVMAVEGLLTIAMARRALAPPA